MTLKTENGIVVPVPSDAFQPTKQLKGMADTTNVPIPVYTQAERDALTKRPGLPAILMYLPGNPVAIWDGTAWTIQPMIQIGQGAAPPIFKSLEVAVTLDAYSVGYIVFPEAFPTKLVSTALMRMHTTAGPVSFNVVADGTSRTGIKFVVNGVPSGTLLYIQYQCWGY
ncbi:hypothetical protein [Arthrobacter sp. GMC3]|uniref:hypothetical protein n=1 Tax=Arthrobacter sp. GMC3 TaxID=2058894 RepID=UPI000CE47D87|nr:hypothetical protein [Arthrobacter sp. GMC3]